uniref:Uncharacterized protein n=2 Tax=Anguilla anguilla TaxID=7936 RepID=A0A0E9RWT2_ANGAN
MKHLSGPFKWDSCRMNYPGPLAMDYCPTSAMLSLTIFFDTLCDFQCFLFFLMFF